MNVFSGYKFLKLIKIVILIPAIAATVLSPSIITIGLCSLLFIVTLLDLYAMNKMEADYRHLYHSAYFDALTGIPNRLSADSYVRKCYADKDVCVAIADLDGLKEINDTYGHQAGDELICEFASVFFACASPLGFAARNGGDEFLAIFAGSDALKNSESFLQSLRTKIAGYNLHAERPLSYSIGSASARKDGCSDIHQVISLADKNMYLYKKGKKKGVFHYDR